MKNPGYLTRLGFVLLSVYLLFSGCTDTLPAENTNPFTPDTGTEIESTIALLHFNPELGQKEENLRALEYYIREAFGNGADFVVTPELATSGYCITKEQVMAGLGFEEPFVELDPIRQLAIEHGGYVFIGLPEIDGEVTYNSIVVFGPEGYVDKQRKRGKSDWHETGNLPLKVVETRYGDIGFLVCSDAYLPDVTRILALEGADIILSPANWWGEGLYGTQLDIWKTNSHDNYIWNFVANRWGSETDERYGYPLTYDMDDSPSAVINPYGEVVFSYRTKDDIQSGNRIFYETATVPIERIGTCSTPSYALNNRKPTAYQAIGNGYYDPDNGNLPLPGLPATGELNYTALAYLPSASFAPNLETLQELFETRITATDVVVAPALGIGEDPIDLDNAQWYTAEQLTQLQDLMEQKGVQLFTTTVNILEGSAATTGSLIIRPGQTPLVALQIHDRSPDKGKAAEPFYLDMERARIGIVTGADFNFPEVTTNLAKSGVDVVLVSSDLGITSPSSENDNYGWTIDQLRSLAITRSNNCIHLLMADHLGYALNIRSEWGSMAEINTTGTAPDALTITLDSGATRIKYLNRYRPSDLEVLLGAR